MKFALLAIPALFLWVAFTPEKTDPMHDEHAPNTLTEAEIQDGWELLFDGKTTAGWRGYGKTGIGSAWKTIDGALVLDDTDMVKNDDGHGTIPDAGDIVTERQFENYELMIDWKISPCGNSGIIFNVIDNGEYSASYFSGPEIQIVDNSCHPDAKIHKHRAGDLYDLVPCSIETVKKAGEWNTVRLKLDNGHLQEWLNGTLVVDTQMWDDNWKEMVANSKFNQWDAFGTARKGHLCLQDHNNKVSFRNIKIKEL